MLAVRLSNVNTEKMLHRAKKIACVKNIERSPPLQVKKITMLRDTTKNEQTEPRRGAFAGNRVKVKTWLKCYCLI